MHIQWLVFQFITTSSVCTTTQLCNVVCRYVCLYIGLYSRVECNNPTLLVIKYYTISSNVHIVQMSGGESVNEYMMYTLYTHTMYVYMSGSLWGSEREDNKMWSEMVRGGEIPHSVQVEEVALYQAWHLMCLVF